MIRLIGVVGKLFVLDLESDTEVSIMLSGGDVKDIDENICNLKELKYIDMSVKTKRVLMSVIDIAKVTSRINELEFSGGGDAPVKSVNTEIGDVVLDASKIKMTDGDSIEEEFSQLASVAYSGDYLDLSNRPVGTGEPFTVIDWDPYNEDLVDIQPVAANASTSYSNGTMSVVTPPSLVAELKDIGYPQSPEIILTQGSNGSPLNINITPSSVGMGKVFTIEDFSSLNIQPLDVFPYDGNAHGVTMSIIIVQLEENETMSSLTIGDIVGKDLRIDASINNLYQNESNGYTRAEFSIKENSESVLNVSVYPYGNYNRLNLKIVNNELFIGTRSPVNLIDYGFDANKKFGALILVEVEPNSFDVATPFNIALSAVKEPPALNCEIPTLLDISVHKDEKLVFIFSDVPMGDDPSNIMQLIVAESSGYVAYGAQVGGEGTGPVTISSEYVDSNGYINYKFNGTEFSLKNNNTLDYDIIVTFPSNVLNYFTIQETDSLLGQPISKTSWSFTINSMQKSMLVDGILPANSIDGSTLRVTNDGFFDNVELKTGDIVTPYSNKTKLLLHRIIEPTPPTIVSSDVSTAGTNAVSGNAVTSFVDGDDALNIVTGKLNVVVSPFGDNILQKTTEGLYVPTPVIPSPETIASNLQSSTTEVVNGTGLSVKRSTDSGNSLELRSNGLYVPTVTAPILDYGLSSSETGRAPTSYTVYNALNSSTIYITGGKAEVKLSTQQLNKLTYSVAGLYVAPEVRSTSVGLGDYNLLESNTVYNVLTSNTLSIVNNKTNVKVENPASSSVQINTSANGISAVLKNIVKLWSVREVVSSSMGIGTRYLGLTNFNVFVIDCGGGSGTVLLNGLNDLDGDQAKTITIIVKNTTALTWAAEFAWVDNIPPTLQPSTTLVVTGIYASNASNATYTAGKILCTFSYFTV